MEKLVVGIAALGPGVGIALIGSAFCQSVARQPEVQDRIFVPALIFAGMIELLGLLGFVSLFL